MAKPAISPPILDPLPGLFAPKPLTPLQRFLRSPLIYLAECLYTRRTTAQFACRPEKPIRIVCVSDTHNLQPELPDGDILLHAGDLTVHGTFDEIQAQLTWLDGQSHRFKIVIAGNHDLLLNDDFDRPGRIQRQPGRRRKDLRWGSLIYLQNSSTALPFPNGRHLKIYGSPRTPEYGDWVFQYPRTRDVFSNTVPPGTDILLTHGPPKYHMDCVGLRGPQGCPHLAKEVWRCRDNLKLVAFGHIHEGHGREHLPYDRMQGLHDSIRLGTGGVFSLVELALLICWERLFGRFTIRKERSGVMMVNAAIATNPWEKESKAPVVVEI